MTIEKGKINYSVLVSLKPIGDGFEDSIVNEAYADRKASLDTPVEDFSTGISLSDIEASKENFSLGSYFYAATRKKQFKMPKSKIKEEVAIAIHQEIARNGGTALNSKRRKEIAENIEAMLQDEAVLETSGSRFVLSQDRKRIIIEETSASKIDEALILITSAVPMETIPDLKVYTPEFLYEIATGESASGYEPFTVSGRYSAEGIGRDFLTWLWAISDSQKNIDGMEGLLVALTGMIQLSGENDGTGPVTVILKDGAPSIGAEVNAGLRQGKKVSKAEFSIADKDLVYKIIIDDQFHFRAFAGPYVPEKGLDIGSNFDGRMFDCVAFMTLIERMFKAFCDDKTKQQTINEWISTSRN